MSKDKSKWWSFFAWPIVGAALAFGVLSFMTIGIFVLPFALVGLFALHKWGGNRKSSGSNFWCRVAIPIRGLSKP